MWLIYKSLHILLKELCKIEDLRWARLLYCYPEEITDDLIQVMKEEDKICNYLDMPIQHASDNVLKRMGRRTNHRELIDIVTKLRMEIPDITFCPHGRPVITVITRTQTQQYLTGIKNR